MNQIKRLVIASYTQNKLDEKKVGKIARLLNKSELREYLDDELGAEYMERLSRGKILRTKKEPRGLIEQKTRDLKAAVLKLSRKFK